MSILGIDPVAYTKIIPLEENLKAGQLRLNNDEAVIGRRLADDLGIRVGDRMNIVTSSNRSLAYALREYLN